MISLYYRSQESLVRHWAKECLVFSDQVNDESLAPVAQRLQEQMTSLLHDRRVLFVGAAQSGKSTLLAGLAGQPWMAQYEFQEPYVRWRCSCRDGEQDASRFIDEFDLMGLELLDTAPLESDGQPERVLALVPRCDILICVLSALRLDDAEIWKLLDELPETWAGHCVFAVTHTDVLDAQEALDLKSQLRDRCHAYQRHPISLYFVPAILATRAMAAFVDRMEETLNSPQGHRGAIRQLSSACDDLLHAQRVVLAARENVQRSDYGFVDKIDKQIDELEGSQLRGHHDAIDYYLHVVRGQLPSLITSIWPILRRGATPSGLLVLECLPEEMELYFYRRIITELSVRQADADQQLIMTCEAHWKEVRPLMKKTLGCDIDEFKTEQMSRDLRQLRFRFLQKIYGVFVTMGMRRKLTLMLIDELAWLKGAFFLLCLMLIAAGVLGAVGLSMIAFIVMSAALIAWMVLCLFLYSAARRIRLGCSKLFQELAEQLEDQIEEPMHQFIIQRVEAYRRMYALPRRRLSEQAASLEPMLKRQSELQRQLRALDPYL